MSPAPTVGMAIPERQHDCDEVQQMLYNASLWNGHRIHFDMPYATEVEGYPGLVVAGPLMGDWLHQVVDEWLGDAGMITGCLLYTSPSPRDLRKSRMPSSA